MISQNERSAYGSGAAYALSIAERIAKCPVRGDGGLSGFRI